MPRVCRTHLTTSVAVFLLAALFGGVLHGSAAGPTVLIGSISSGATVSEGARPVAPSVDVVSISERGGLTTDTVSAAVSAAAMSGAQAVYGRGFQLGMRRLLRGTQVVQQSSGSGWGIPMAVTALPVDAIRAVMGRAVAGPVTQWQLVMGSTTAMMRGARVGDRVELMAPGGWIAVYSIGAIVSDDEVGGTEIVMSTDMATGLGVLTNTRVLIYGSFDRSVLDFHLGNGGLLTNSRVQAWHSWDRVGPDAVMSMIETKVHFGEFDLYYDGLTDTGWTMVNPDWAHENLPATREAYPTGIAARCHNVIRADLYAALAEVAATYPELINSVANDASESTGLDIANTNRYGGCTPYVTGGGGVARLSRNGISTGIVSRHSWGVALDTSTAANCQGCVPVIDCRIVYIFRKHNFAWGGTFLTPDGMHFEWVGERRDLNTKPMPYCPNPQPQPSSAESTGSQGSIAPVQPVETMRSRLFADDGWMLTD